MKRRLIILALALPLGAFCETINYGFWAATPSFQRIVGSTSQRVPGGGWKFSIPPRQKGGTLILESEVPVDITLPLETLAISVDMKKPVSNPPIFAAAHFTGQQGKTFKARLKAEGAKFTPVFEISDDGCRTWPVKLDLVHTDEADKVICYPHAFIDEKQQCLYVACDNTQTHYLFTVPLADVTNV